MNKLIFTADKLKVVRGKRKGYPLPVFDMRFPKGRILLAIVFLCQPPIGQHLKTPTHVMARVFKDVACVKVVINYSLCPLHAHPQSLVPFLNDHFPQPIPDLTMCLWVLLSIMT